MRWFRCDVITRTLLERRFLMLAPIIIGGVLAVLTFIGLTIADRRDPSRWYDDAYENALRKRRSPHTW